MKLASWKTYLFYNEIKYNNTTLIIDLPVEGRRSSFENMDSALSKSCALWKMEETFENLSIDGDKDRC
jgi:hypothetical protein